MDKRYRNLGVLVVIVVLAIAVYYLVQLPKPVPQPGQENSFDSGLQELKVTWSEAGLSESYMSLGSMDFVDDAVPGQFASLEENLAYFKESFSGKNNALESLAGIYLHSAELFSDYLQISDSLLALPETDSEGICSQLPMIESDSVKVSNYLDSAIELSGEISAFKASYPSEAAKAGLSGLAFNKSDLQDAKSGLEESVLSIKNFCEATP